MSELCELLVKLCHINCSGPVFFETHCSSLVPQQVHSSTER